MPAYGEAAEEKRQHEAEEEKRGYWHHATALRERIGEQAATRLMQLMPEDALRTGGPVTPKAPEDVVQALVDCHAAEVSDRPRLTFAGKYILHYLRLQLEGKTLSGLPVRSPMEAPPAPQEREAVGSGAYRASVE